MNANFEQENINQGINPSIIISSPNVVCECGNKTVVSASHLTSNHTTSCGC